LGFGVVKQEVKNFKWHFKRQNDVHSKEPSRSETALLVVFGLRVIIKALAITS
jgi:hypothetical protein